MTNESNPGTQISKLVKFRLWSACPGSPGDLRLAIYQNGFTRPKGAQSELMGTLLLKESSVFLCFIRID